MDRFLAGVAALQALAPAELAELAERAMLRRYRKGEPVFEEGRAADAVFLLREGLIKAVKWSPRAEPASMEIIVPGQFFGMIAVLDAKPYPVSAIPISPCQAYRVPAAVFSALMTRRPAFARQVLSSVGEHLRQAQSLRALAGESVERRIAHVLLALSRAMGPVLAVRREDVAELAGCTPATAIRTLSALKAKRVISSGWKRITIGDPKRLQALAGEP